MESHAKVRLKAEIAEMSATGPTFLIFMKRDAANCMVRATESSELNPGWRTQINSETGVLEAATPWKRVRSKTDSSGGIRANSGSSYCH
jgi:hypothetical protein